MPDAEAMLQTINQIGRITTPGVVEVFYDPDTRPALYALAVMTLEVAKTTQNPNKDRVASFGRAAAILLFDETKAQTVPATLEQCFAVLHHVGDTPPPEVVDAIARVGIDLIQRSIPNVVRGNVVSDADAVKKLAQIKENWPKHRFAKSQQGDAIAVLLSEGWYPILVLDIRGNWIDVSKQGPPQVNGRPVYAQTDWQEVSVADIGPLASQEKK